MPFFSFIFFHWQLFSFEHDVLVPSTSLHGVFNGRDSPKGKYSLSTIFVLFQEFNKHDKEPSKYIKRWTGIKPKTGVKYTCDIGYERFLGPEVVDFNK